MVSSESIGTKPRSLLGERLAAHRLAAPLPVTPAELVSRFGAMQAQESVPSKWSIGQRIPAGTEAVVDAALRDGTVVRVHALRPTWHYLSARDLRWIQRLTAERVHVSNASRYRALELDPRTLARGHRLITRALEGGRQLTRAELGARLHAAGLPVEGQRLAHLVMHAELECLVCSGAPRGKAHTYALVEERVPPVPALDRDEAMGELAARYFKTRGPATERDFRWWSSLKAAEARRAVEIAGRELEELRFDGRTYWLAADRAPQPSRSPAGHLLQRYDEFIVAYSESRDLIGADPLTQPYGRLRNVQVAVLGGRTIGRWRPRLASREAVLELEPLAPLDTRARAALRAAASRFGRYLERPVRLEVLALARD